MEPPSGPRAASLHEFHSVGRQSDMGSNIEETTDDNCGNTDSNFFALDPKLVPKPEV
jgi:hypothetical protein